MVVFSCVPPILVMLALMGTPMFVWGTLFPLGVMFACWFRSSEKLLIGGDETMSWGMAMAVVLVVTIEEHVDTGEK